MENYEYPGDNQHMFLGVDIEDARTFLSSLGYVFDPSENRERKVSSRLHDTVITASYLRGAHRSRGCIQLFSIGPQHRAFVIETNFHHPAVHVVTENKAQELLVRGGRKITEMDIGSEMIIHCAGGLGLDAKNFDTERDLYASLIEGIDDKAYRKWSRRLLDERGGDLNARSSYDRLIDIMDSTVREGAPAILGHCNIPDKIFAINEGSKP